MVNATEFGIACYFYAHDIGRVWRPFGRDMV